MVDVFSYVSNNLYVENDLKLSPEVVKNVIKLFDKDMSIPFIARYRKKETGNLDAEVLRLIEQNCEYHRKLQNKICTVLKKIEKEDVSKDYKDNIKNARTIDEVEEMYSPFKKGTKTLAERARNLGLQEIATSLLKENRNPFYFQKFINTKIEGLESVESVKAGIQHIIADEVAKDNTIFDKLRGEIESRCVFLSTKKTNKAKELDPRQKYKLYYETRKPSHYLKNHQILAINRAEKEKIIHVTLEIEGEARKRFLSWIKQKWIPRNSHSSNIEIVDKSIEDSFKRLIEKKFFRRIRTKLTKTAEKDAVLVFSSNLKHLLLVAPVKNRTIISIDPGFHNGCKIAVIDKLGALKDTSVIFPFKDKTRSEKTLIDLSKKYGASLVAIGNGTACRETEKFVSELIKSKRLTASYSIVDECGASIYSVTDDAKKEFGNLDPNLISSVSIGRRLQDPLIELTKIEPKHLGVGMYQHDVDEKLLHAALEDAISDCVNFVGVDLNACSCHLLRRIAGLNEKRAEAIINHRNIHGEFVNREELLSVKSIGKVTYHNCAGFVRIVPKEPEEILEVEEIEPTSKGRGAKRKLLSNNTSSGKKTKTTKKLQPDLFDRTWIHPESYPIASRLLTQIGVSKDMIGTKEMKEIIDVKFSSTKKIEELSQCLRSDIHTVQLILDGLKQASDFDARDDFEKPIFKSEVTSIEDLKCGVNVTGSVRNVTSFGAFVDIGVKENGLVHNNDNPLKVELGPGDKVECRIKNIELERGRISLLFLNKISKDLVLF